MPPHATPPHATPRHPPSTHAAAVTSLAPPRPTPPSPPPLPPLQAQAFPEVLRLTEAQQEALAAINEAAEALHISYDLQPGDIQLLHNWSQLHTRTAFVDNEVGAAGGGWWVVRVGVQVWVWVWVVVGGGLQPAPAKSKAAAAGAWAGQVRKQPRAGRNSCCIPLPRPPRATLWSPPCAHARAGTTAGTCCACGRCTPRRHTPSTKSVSSRGGGGRWHADRRACGGQMGWACGPTLIH